MESAFDRLDKDTQEIFIHKSRLGRNKFYLK